MDVLAQEATKDLKALEAVSAPKVLEDATRNRGDMESMVVMEKMHAVFAALCVSLDV